MGVNKFKSCDLNKSAASKVWATVLKKWIGIKNDDKAQYVSNLSPAYSLNFTYRLTKVFKIFF